MEPYTTETGSDRLFWLIPLVFALQNLLASLNFYLPSHSVPGWFKSLDITIMHSRYMAMYIV